ncbi:MAG: serine/threonine-protein kinase [Nannocystaceae bacterium]|nr:serine/threonine-protein kinase [Nannocystaceae bacterium]
MQSLGDDVTLGATGADTGVATRHPVELAPGQAVGRYVVLDRLGHGGMGVVYAAYDPALDRKVAIKFLRAPGTTAQARARLLQEARALATLTHPNVVAVFDAGTLGERVWIAMEFVHGVPLSTWLRAQQPTWPVVLEALLMAARGLRAAHHSGLVHRDVKPDNVMIDTTAEGRLARVRLADFGLAQWITPASDDDTRTADGSDSAPGPTGHGGGTPGYMAPEQAMRQPLDARADQFGWCVMAWEALAGERPFAGDHATAILARVYAGEIRPVPRTATAPRWLFQQLRRGLAADPGGRAPDLDTLIDAIAHRRAGARWRSIVASALTLAAIVGAGHGATWLAARHRVQRCHAQSQAAAEIWNAATATRIEQAFARTGSPQATDAIARTGPRLDAHVLAWREVHDEVCRRAEALDWEPRYDEAARTCLDEQRWALEALLATLEQPTRGFVERAALVASNLESPRSCIEPQALDRRPPMPADADERAEIEAIQREHARAHALEDAGQPAAALDVAEPALARARALGWEPLVAVAWMRVGSARARAGRYAEAVPALVEAYFCALDADVEGTAVDAATRLAIVIGYRMAEHDVGELWARHAAAILERTPGLRTREAALQSARALVDYARGDFASAQRLASTALALQEAELGPDHPDVATAASYVGMAAYAAGDLATSQAMYDRMIAIDEVQLGPTHPILAVPLVNLANIHFSRGELDAAIDKGRRALAIQERAVGRDHPDVATTLSNLSAVLQRRGDAVLAEELAREALAIRERRLGPDHPDVATALQNLAATQRDLGHRTEARALLARALEIRERAFPDGSGATASSLMDVAQLDEDDGDLAAADATYARALTMCDATLGPGHDDCIGARASLDRVRRTRGRTNATGAPDP